ncbi:MAG: hypothetical protein L0219_16360, partial [Phycisphaerales bacterium]|nr:hypothetical protein [Phycisphaerales bacterium]
MKLIGISRGTELFGNGPIARCSSTGYSFDQIEVEDGVVLLALLEEDPDEDKRFGGTLVTLFGQTTESPRLWYGTGNPFRLFERWAMPVRLPNGCVPTSLPFRRLPIVDELAASHGSAPDLVPTDQLLCGLAPVHRPQQRWLRAPLGDVVGAIKQRLRPFEWVDPGTAVSRATDIPGLCIYIYAADGLRHWVKLGSSANSAMARLQSQQLCNPRPLGHLAVWRTDAASQADLDCFESQLIERLAAPVLDRSPLRREGSKRRFRKEWLKLDWDV